MPPQPWTVYCLMAGTKFLLSGTSLPIPPQLDNNMLSIPELEQRARGRATSRILGRTKHARFCKPG